MTTMIDDSASHYYDPIMIGVYKKGGSRQKMFQ